MPTKTPGRPRREPWSALPAGKLLTLEQAAEILCVTRKTLQSEYVSGRRPVPADVEVITDGGRVLLFRHTQREG